MNRNFFVFQVFFLLSGAILAQNGTNQKQFFNPGSLPGESIFSDRGLDYCHGESDIWVSSLEPRDNNFLRFQDE